jgi:phosphoribosylglycinamide formyltransferase-1
MQASEAEKPRIVILISGTGSNMVAIADAVQAEGSDSAIDAEIVGVISNRPTAGGIEKAQALGLHTDLIDHTLYASRDEFDHALIRMIEDLKPDLVVLAGFMRILTADFTRYYEGRLINIHPSLLPKYQGLNTHQRALDAGDNSHGVTVHFVTEELDDGPNAIQAIVPILDIDNAPLLQQRVHEQEHIIYPIAVKWFCEGRLTMKGSKALLDGKPLPATGIQLDTRI